MSVSAPVLLRDGDGAWLSRGKGRRVCLGPDPKQEPFFGKDHAQTKKSWRLL
jgi:hypothetical protein